MKKVLSLILAILMLTLSVSMVACDKGDEDETTTAVTTAEATTEATKKVLKMGTNAEFPPYEYYDDNGKIVGIDAEIAAAIADKLGMELEIVDMKFDSILSSIQTGGVDVGIAGMTVTDERLESVNFSDSYATGVQVVIVKENSDIKTLEDLEGKKIGVQLATTGDIFASDDFGEENVTKYNKGADAVQALIGGDVDAVIIDNEPAKAFVKANTGLSILETEYAVEEYAIAIAKDNTELLEQINAALEELIADGTIDKIIAKYIKSE